MALTKIDGEFTSPDFADQNIATTGSNTAGSFIPTSSTAPVNGVYLAAANKVAIATNSTGKIFIDSSGRVGIGTTSPQSSLSVAGSIPNSPSTEGVHLGLTSNYAVMQLNGNTGGIIDFAEAGVDNAGRIIYTHSSDAMQFQTAASTKMTIESSGNVGIGSSSPGDFDSAANQLVIQNSGSCGITIDATSSTNSSIHFADGPDGSEAYRGYILYRHNGDSMAFGTNGGVERMRIDSSGRLGLGTSSPNAKLHIAEASTETGGDINANADGLVVDNSGGNTGLTFKTPNTASSRICFGDPDDNNAGQILYNHSDNSLAIDTSGSERLKISSSGKVGIGTTSTALRHLTVHDSGAESVYLNVTNANTGSGGTTGFLIGINAVTDPIATLWNYENSAMRFATSATERMRIDSSGRLLVGTTSSSQVNTAVFQGNSASGSGAGVIISSTLNNPSSTQVLGKLAFADNGHVDAASIRGRRDGGTWTSGSSQPTSLTFSTTADGASSPTERMRLSQQGRLDVFSSDTPLRPRSATSAGVFNALIYGLHSATSTSNGTNSFIVWTNGNVQNTNNSYGAISDIKLKENIVDASSQWDDLKAIQVRNYNFIEGQTHTQIGVVAQEVETVSPGLVSESPDRDKDGSDLGTTTKSVNYSVLYMKAVKALQEAMTRIETLEKRLSDAGIA